MRTLLAALALSSAVAGVHAGNLAAAPVDLDRPGALEALRQSDPVRHERIVRILADAETLTPAAAPGILRARHDARDARLGMTIRTSFPAIGRLDFTLDEVRYTRTVRLRGAPPEVVR